MINAPPRVCTIVVTAAAVHTALGDARSQILSRAIARERVLAPSTAMEGHADGASLDNRTFACAGGSTEADRAEILLASTLADALREARLDTPAARGNRRIRLIVGTTLNGMRHIGAFLRGAPARDAAWLTASSVASKACELCGLPAAGMTISTACASGITAIGIGCDLLRNDDADIVIAGGYDPVSEFSHAGFAALRLLADGPPRPFAHDRDGMRTAEGCGLLVLERADSGDRTDDTRSIARRGARVLARVACVAESSDAFHLTQPHPTGAGAAFALAEAVRLGGTPDLIVAHATGTEANDAAEYAAYHRTFGDALNRIPVTAMKAAIGHTLGAAGAVDAALCIAMAERASAIPTLVDASTVDAEAFPALSLVVAPRSMTIQRTMNVALGFGGSNAVLVLDHAPASAPSTTVPLNGPHGVPPPHSPGAMIDSTLVITGWSAIVPGAAVAGAAVASLSELRPGAVDDALLAPYLDVRSARRIAPISRLVRAVVRMALDDASLPPELVARSTGICATHHGAVEYSMGAYRDVVVGGLGAGNPLLFAESVPNVPGAQCSLAFGMREAAITVIGSRVGVVEALLIARARLLAGCADRVILVTAEETHADLDAVLLAWKQPRGAHACCASGAVAFVIERASAALARGATARARLGTLHWQPPSTRAPRALLAAARCVASRLHGTIDVPGRPGLLGRLERRAVGGRCGATLGAELHAAGPALLALQRAARQERAAVLALDPFGAAAGFELHPVGGAT